MVSPDQFLNEVGADSLIDVIVFINSINGVKINPDEDFHALKAQMEMMIGTSELNKVIL